MRAIGDMATHWGGGMSAQSARDWFPLLFAGWLVMAVLGPDKATGSILTH